MKLGEWIPVWLRCYKYGTMKQSSYHQLENLIKHIPSSLMEQEMDEILPMDLQAFVNSFATYASKSYMDKMRVLIHAVWATALDNQKCTTNPSKAVRFPVIPEKPRESFSSEDAKTILTYALQYDNRIALDNQKCTTNPSKAVRFPVIPEKPRESFSSEDAKTILTYALQYDNRMVGVAVMTLLLTGIRRGELLGLKWSDLSNTTLSINRGVYLENGHPCVREYVAKTPTSIRVVPLLPELAYYLSSLPRTCEFIFCTKNRTIISPRNFSRSYTAFFRHLNEDCCCTAYLSPHCCRHTFASLCLDAGADVRTVQQLLGHGDIRSTSRYVHPQIETLQNAVSDMRDFIVDRSYA